MWLNIVARSLNWFRAWFFHTAVVKRSSGRARNQTTVHANLAVMGFPSILLTGLCATCKFKLTGQKRTKLCLKLWYPGCCHHLVSTKSMISYLSSPRDLCHGKQGDAHPRPNPTPATTSPAKPAPCVVCGRPGPSASASLPFQDTHKIDAP